MRNSKLIRKGQRRRFKKLIVLSSEGSKTEPKYFHHFETENTDIHFELLYKKGKSAPIQVLKRAKDHLKSNPLKKQDECWLVVDIDNWPEKDLKALIEWAKSKNQFSVAFSNPKIEYWLLLHFEDGNKLNSPREVVDKLISTLPNYDKGKVEMEKIFPGVNDAIQRAEIKDNPQTNAWTNTYGSTLYRLVKKLL